MVNHHIRSICSFTTSAKRDSKKNSEKIVIERGLFSESEHLASRGEHQDSSTPRNGETGKQDLIRKDSSKKQQRDMGF